MRKIIGILVCLWVSLQLSAVSYQPCKSVYRSPGSYSVSGTGYSGSGFRSTSAYQPSSNQDILSNVQAYQTMSSISASNVEALKSEGAGALPLPRELVESRPSSGSRQSAVDCRQPATDNPPTIDPPPEPPKKGFANRSDILNDPVLNDLLKSMPGATIADIKENRK